MNKKMMSAVALVVMGSVAVSQAAVIVDYNAPATRTNGVSATTSTSFGDTWAFSDTSPLFAGGDGQNNIIYGGAITTWTVEEDYKPSVVQVNGSGAQIQLKPAGNATSTQRALGAFVWNNADFLNGTAGTTVELGAGSTISMSVLESGVTEYRAVVNQGGTYYVSNDSAVGAALSIADASATTWALLNTADYTYGTFGALTMDDVDGVGVWFDNSRVNNLSRFRVTDLQVNAIPEPATLGLVAAFGGGILFLRRFLQL